MLRTFAISALSLVTTPLGVPAGARIANQVKTSREGKPASIIVGTSGNIDARLAPATPRAFSLPALT